MINPEELMIGNYVEYKGLEVRWDLNDFAEAANSKNILEIANPIPLDEAWLLKLGFENDGVTFKKDWIDVWDSAYSGYQLRIYKVGNDYEKAINIDYVHQLQNLYYALSGNHLTKK